MPADIASREDLVLLIDTFYSRVRNDATIGPIFNTIIGDDWSTHLPLMYTFWNTVLFGQEGYKGNAVTKHIEIDKQLPLQPAHFDRWVRIWRETVHQLFEGPKAEMIQKKAEMILTLIQLKVIAHRSGKALM